MARNGFHMLLISCKLKKINLGKFLNLLEILKIEPRSSRFSGNTAFANSSKRKQLLPLQDTNTVQTTQYSQFYHWLEIGEIYPYKA